jgi:hypothetical protein
MNTTAPIPDAAPALPADGPVELTAEQIAVVAGGSPKGTWIDLFCDVLGDLGGSPKGTW